MKFIGGGGGLHEKNHCGGGGGVYMKKNHWGGGLKLWAYPAIDAVH